MYAYTLLAAHPVPLFPRKFLEISALIIGVHRGFFSRNFISDSRANTQATLREPFTRRLAGFLRREITTRATKEFPGHLKRLRKSRRVLTAARPCRRGKEVRRAASLR